MESRDKATRIKIEDEEEAPNKYGQKFYSNQQQSQQPATQAQSQSYYNFGNSNEESQNSAAATQESYFSKLMTDNSRESELQNTKSYFLELMKSNRHLIPKEYRSKALIFDKLQFIFLFSNFAFNLYQFIMHYPDVFVGSHTKAIKLPTLGLVGLFSVSMFLSKNNYEQCWQKISTNHSDPEIKEIIQQYYSINQQNLNNSIIMNSEPKV